MAFDALRSTIRRDTVPAGSPDGQAAPAFGDPAAMVDGGVDAAVHACPSCGRTIVRGAGRCEGCGTRLVLDTPVRRASTFAGGGVVAGVLVTLLLVNLLGPAGGSAPADTAGAGDGTGTAGNPVAVVVPVSAAAALRGTTAINGRLVSAAEPLASALAAKSFKATDVVKVLRRMNIDTRAGAGMVKAFATWPEAAGQQAALAAFYADLDEEINTGLAASARSASAYKQAAKAVLATLGQVVTLDADARVLASGGGIDLAPVEIPDAVR
jgi:hypothetical protein